MDEEICAAFRSDLSSAAVAESLGVGRQRVLKVWKASFGAGEVRARANRLRSRPKKEDPQQRAAALPWFAEGVAVKEAARRLGVHYLKVQRWWIEEFGEEVYRSRGKRLQAARTAANNRRGLPKTQTVVRVACEDCGTEHDRTMMSLAKAARLICPTCKSKKQDPHACPVCGFVFEGARGLASHFRHQRNCSAHKEYRRKQWEVLASRTDEYVTCQECGFVGRSISAHIQTHDLNWRSYTRKYPGAPLYSAISEARRRARIRETHARYGFTYADFKAYLDDEHRLIVAAAAKGLGVAQDTVRTYAKKLDIPTRNRLAWQREVLQTVADVLGEAYKWEWSDDRIRNPETGRLLNYDGCFPKSKVIVECHGIQHYQFVPRWHRLPEEFVKLRERDVYKKERAEELGYTVIEVRYDAEVSREFFMELLRAPKKSRQAVKDKAETILRELRRDCFPFPVIDPEETRRELERLQRKRLKLVDGIIVPRSWVGTKVCKAYFPNLFQARYKNQLSAVEAWNSDEKLRLAILTQLDSSHPTTPERVLKAILMHHRVPTVFRPAYARYLYDRYCPEGKTTWDPCAGWGGRLLGAAAANVRYIGTEIDALTVEGNRRLASDLRHDAEIIEGSALGADIPQVDFVFTSPPYYDVEQYSDHPEQPHMRFGSEEDWVEGFLLPLVRKARSVLPQGCAMALNLSDALLGRLEECAFDCGFELETVVGFELPNGKVARTAVYR